MFMGNPYLLLILHFYLYFLMSSCVIITQEELSSYPLLANYQAPLSYTLA